MRERAKVDWKRVLVGAGALGGIAVAMSIVLAQIRPPPNKRVYMDAVVKAVSLSMLWGGAVGHLFHVGKRKSAFAIIILYAVSFITLTVVAIQMSAD